MRRVYLLEENEGLEYQKYLDSQSLWQDNIQNGQSPWGFDQIRCDFNGVTLKSFGDEFGVNLSRVASPDGNGFCLRHYGDLSQPGSSVRSQVGMVIPATEFNLEHECYLPQALSAYNDPYSWMGLLDVHVMDPDTANRSYLGMNVHPDGSMRVTLAQLGTLYPINKTVPQPWSNISLPVGRWFKIRLHFIKSETPTTVSLYLDDVLAVEYKGVITSLPSNKRVEAYVKLYGGVQINSRWGKVVRYSRNTRIYG